MGWAGVKNGELLRRAEREFDLFLTADKKLTISAEPERPPLGDSGVAVQPPQSASEDDRGN
jgi:hypothetical protein